MDLSNDTASTLNNVTFGPYVFPSNDPIVVVQADAETWKGWLENNIEKVDADLTIGQLIDNRDAPPELAAAVLIGTVAADGAQTFYVNDNDEVLTIVGLPRTVATEVVAELAKQGLPLTVDDEFTGRLAGVSYGEFTFRIMLAQFATHMSNGLPTREDLSETVFRAKQDRLDGRPTTKYSA